MKAKTTQHERTVQMSALVIGAGGAGSFLVPALCMLIGKDKVVVMDGDNLESKNLNRQLFTTSDIGRNKAEALSEKYGCDFLPEWFAFGARRYESWDTLIAVVDNHPARASVLQACDYHKCMAVIAANERTSSEGYVYFHEWKDTNLDPRTYYPELLTVTDGDPRSAAIGCTGIAQEESPQLVSANLNAAALACHLFMVWTMEAPKLSEEDRQHLPHKLTQTLSRSESFKAQIK